MEQYWVMDGRANYSIDDAYVLVTCDTFDEAMDYVNDYGDDTCIVKILGDNQELVYSLLTDHTNVIIASQVDADDIQDSVVIGSKVKAKPWAKLRKVFLFGSKIDIE